MALWVNKLELKDLWELHEKDKISVSDLAKEVAKRIKSAPFYEKYMDDLEEIVDMFEACDDDTAEFDHILSDLYDWGDISLDGKFGGRKMCWINTF